MLDQLKTVPYSSCAFRPFRKKCIQGVRFFEYDECDVDTRREADAQIQTWDRRNKNLQIVNLKKTLFGVLTSLGTSVLFQNSLSLPGATE